MNDNEGQITFGELHAFISLTAVLACSKKLWAKFSICPAASGDLVKQYGFVLEDGKKIMTPDG